MNQKDNQGNKDDLLAFMQERMLPVDEIEAGNIAEELLTTPPEVGYLTSSWVCVRPERRGGLPDSKESV